MCGGNVARKMKVQAGPAFDKIRVEVPGIIKKKMNYLVLLLMLQALS